MRKLDSYIELGLTGMMRGGNLSWFDGHYGAALLAGYFMSKENELPEHVLTGIERTCEHYKERYTEWFAPLEWEEPQPELLNKLISGLSSNTANLRTSGHGIALGVLALKALQERPDLITPSIIGGLTVMLERTTQDREDRYFGVSNYFELSENDATAIPVYESSLDMAIQAFQELNIIVPDRNIDGKGYFFSGEKEHGVTHAHALIELERLGYKELLARGMSNHRLQLYLHRNIPDFAMLDEIKEPIYTSILSEQYWSNTFRDPHALKVPYAALSLLKIIPENKREEAQFNICKIMTILS